MNIKTLSLKPIIVKNGIEMIDFAEPTYIPIYDSSDFIVTKQIEVTSEYNSRADLLSLGLNNTTNELDIILKCNEISDPLSIKEGDLIIVPFRSKSKKFYITPKKESTSVVTDDFLDKSKKSKKDIRRLEEISLISAIKNASPKFKKTNELQDNAKNINIDSNILIL